MRRVLESLLFPVVLFGGVAAGATGMALGGSPAGWVAGVTATAAAVLLVAQRWIPYEARWRGTPGEFGVDLVHSGLTGLTSEAVRAGLWAALVGMAADRGPSGPWPDDWPWVAQLALALIVGDLGAYVVHRGAHGWGPLWRIHAMHHSAEHMYVFASGRNHPLNVALTYAAQAGPLLLLGAGGTVLALAALFTSILGLLQHANVSFRHGPFNLMFATADLHRWHHHPNPGVAAHNFGSNLALWDAVFGTRWLPPGVGCHDAGLDDRRVPPNLWLHLASPFVWGRWPAPGGDPAGEARHDDVIA